jgi:hypothetical protein
MQTISVDVSRDVETCWRAFVDVTKLPSWVPGLRRAEILTRARGLPEEVHFEFAPSRAATQPGAERASSPALAYTLVYSYDREERVVRWEPKLGKRAGVTGFVRFEPAGTSTRITYGLEHGDDRGPVERELGDLRRLADAFAAWVQR